MIPPAGLQTLPIRISLIGFRVPPTQSYTYTWCGGFGGAGLGVVNDLDRPLQKCSP